jgi:hypothetical protein
MMHGLCWSPPALVATALVVIALLWAPAAPAAEPSGSCQAVAVRGAKARVAHGVSSFSARQEVDLSFQVVFPGSFAGQRVVRLDVRTPSGHLYERRAVPVADAPKPGATRVVAGYPRPLRVHALQPASRGEAGRVLKVAFPVAGTSITKSGLYGRWRVDVAVDGEKQPCAAVEFELTE